MLASDSRLRPDRYALEMGDLAKAGAEKSRYAICNFFLSLQSYSQQVENIINLFAVILHGTGFCIKHF